MGSPGASVAARTLAVSGLLLLSACGSTPKACSTVGVASGVQVDFSDIRGAHRSQGLDVTACVGNARCQTLRGARSPVWAGVIPGADPVQVRVRIVTPGGRPLFRGHTRVTPVKVQPNGPDCPPTAWLARVVATGRHTLTPHALG